MGTGQFIGFALNAIDGKGRLSVPAPFREAVAARSGDGRLYLGRHEHERCLTVFDTQRMGRLDGEIERRFAGDYGAERDAFQRRVFGLREPVGHDETGRIIVSATMRAVGELGERAFFLGMGDWFEMWNPDVLLDVRGDDPVLAAIVRGHLGARR